MSNIFFCSDHHFHHANILTFERKDGNPLRKFKDVDHMDEYMVMQHNRVVKSSDKVYFLGDVTIARNAYSLEILGRMNGHKILIKGNHDHCKAKQYLEYFKDIRAYHHIEDIILSHIPIHPECFGHWKLNVHGHLHANVVLLENSTVPDIRYLNVSMEQLKDYTPMSLEEVRTHLMGL